MAEQKIIELFTTENNANSRRFLSENQMSPETTDRICRVINSVSFSQNRGRIPDTLEGRIVQDADRLDAMGAVGIARTFAYGGEHGRTLEDSIQHFYDKLLLLKDLMNTDTGKAIASAGSSVYYLQLIHGYNRGTSLRSMIQD